MPNTLRAGLLRHEVVLQSLGARFDDGYGGGSISDTDVVTVWADVEPLQGVELFQAAQFNPSVNYRITIRYYPGIRPSWKVKYGTRVFDIKSVIDVDERHRKIELMCEELPAP